VRRKKALNPSGSAIIAKNWDKKATLSQNYKRLGLVAKLGHTAGGVEPDAAAVSSAPITKPTKKSRGDDPLAITAIQSQVYSEARVERDPVTGKITRIISSSSSTAFNPLNDPLAKFDRDSDAESDEEEEAEEWDGFEEDKGKVVHELERMAKVPREKRVRHQSEREMEWLQRLRERHGDDFQAMARDLKSNPMQQTAADIRKRFKKAGLIE
jgi:nucleolar protein 16